MNRMRRAAAASLLWILCGAACARAESLAVIRGATLVPYNQFVEGFRHELPGGWIQYDLQADESNTNFVTQAIGRQRPSVIVAVGPRAARLARSAMPGVTLVCALVDNPAKLNLGSGDLYWMSPQAEPGEVVRSLHVLAPAARSLGLVSSTPDSPYLRSLARAGAAEGVEVHVQEVRSEAAVPEQFRRAVQSSDAVWFLQDPVSASPESFDFAKRLCAERRVPLLVFSESLARAGALMSLSPDYDAVGRQGARLVKRVLAGAAQPGLVPLEAGSVTRTLNARTAAEIGLAMPATTALALHILR